MIASQLPTRNEQTLHVMTVFIDCWACSEAPGDLLTEPQLASRGFFRVERDLLSTGIAQLITATRR